MNRTGFKLLMLSSLSTLSNKSVARRGGKGEAEQKKEEEEEEKGRNC